MVMILICVKLHNLFTRHGFGGLVKQRGTAFHTTVSQMQCYSFSRKRVTFGKEDMNREEKTVKMEHQCDAVHSSAGL